MCPAGSPSAYTSPPNNGAPSYTFCALCVLFLTWTVGMTDLLRWALILLFTLPGPYVLPVFARGEADARYASSCLSLYTLLSVAMFCVIAVLAV